MSRCHNNTIRPPPMTIPSAANQLWFQNSLVTIRVSASEGQDGVSVQEHLVPYGFSPPLHLHRTEDEVMHVLEGEFRVRVPGPGTSTPRWRYVAHAQGRTAHLPR